MASEENVKNNIEINYAQTIKVAEIHWELRYKVMTRFFASIAGVFVIAGWFFKEPELKAWTFAPFVIGACFSVISYLLDRVNNYVLRDCYRLAKELEQRMQQGEGIFTCIESTHYNKTSYYAILKLLYFGTAAFFVFLSVACYLVFK